MTKENGSAERNAEMGNGVESKPSMFSAGRTSPEGVRLGLRCFLGQLVEGNLGLVVGFSWDSKLVGLW